MSGIFRIIIQSLSFNRKPVFYQVLIIVLLSAVITGSLLTGKSVKMSLKKSASEHLGNTGIVISSGIRYFDPELVRRMRDSAHIIGSGILEINGFCEELNSQKVVFNTHIFGVTGDFFIFQGDDSIDIKSGEVAVNKQLADNLGIKPGDDIIIRFKEISAIPADAPFAAAESSGKSIVMKVATILEPSQNGNFSLSISQMTPMNIFINLSDIESDQGASYRINRLLIKKNINYSLNRVSESLKHNLKPSDIGLKLRPIKKTGEEELFSDRIFIDEEIIKEISKILPSSAPVITYLGNRFEFKNKSTPYSFVSALPSSLYSEMASGNDMIINDWMAKDLSIAEGDTLRMYWYSPDSLNNLIEKGSSFIIKRIVDMKGIMSDSLLMPVFPGISGKEFCSDWDAGIPIKMHQIRPKDEDYWKRFRGTPKAFIGYEKGRELWGNNFGPATAIRYPAGITEKEIKTKLTGSLDPSMVGFIINDLEAESVRAANEGIDFGTLFLSLGFFLIIVSLFLLSFATSSYFEAESRHINTLYALGFKNRWITKLLLLETGIIAFAGCSIGVFTGYLFNLFITKALNTVWIGAVQTDTLDAYFDPLSVLTGFIVTFLTLSIFMLIKVRRYLRGLSHKPKEIYKIPSSKRNLILLFSSILITISLFVLYISGVDKQPVYSFASGTVLLFSLILLWRQFYIGRYNSASGLNKTNQLSKQYYAFSPGNAITPILFIAAGIFTVFITSTNRMNFNEKETKRSGGTGGYLLWCENAIPVKEDLNTESGRKTLGLDNDSLSPISFIQMKRFSGNDASCLNLNHIKAPPLLGIDPADFILKRAFSFSKRVASGSINNPWDFLNIPSENNTVYGIADQTVLEWGLKLKTGDTLVVRAENGHPLNIIIAAGLETSVFQGNVLIGRKNFIKYYPSVAGSSVFLVDGNSALTELYRNVLNDRLANYGINIEKTTDRLASFYRVTNTYLSVFTLFGALGMIIGVVGLGFVLLRNYSQRKLSFALMLAVGFPLKKIRKMILSEQILILFAGVTTGIIPALLATLSSLRNNSGMLWLFMIVMTLSIVCIGSLSAFLSLRSVTGKTLIASLKKE